MPIAQWLFVIIVGAPVAWGGGLILADMLRFSRMAAYDLPEERRASWVVDEWDAHLFGLALLVILTTLLGGPWSWWLPGVVAIIYGMAGRLLLKSPYGQSTAIRQIIVGAKMPMLALGIWALVVAVWYTIFLQK